LIIDKKYCEGIDDGEKKKNKKGLKVA
jgi:hypothetical protein